MEVEQIISAFDSSQDLATANKFFDQLGKEDFLDEPIAFAANTPIDSVRQQVWYWSAEWFYDRQGYKDAQQYAEKALPLYRGSSLDKASCLNILGLSYLRLGDFQKAADYSKQSLDVEQEFGDIDRISSALNNLAGIYMAASMPAEAEQYILMALDYAERADAPQRKAVLLGMASETYHSLGDDNKALAYAAQAYTADSLLGNTERLMVRLSQKASALHGLGRYAEAEEAYRHVIPAFRESGNIHSLAIADNKMGSTLTHQGRLDEAVPYYREAAGLLSEMGDLYNEIFSHMGLYECYWKTNPDSARQELELSLALKDSLYRDATAEAMSRYNAMFGNELLQRENEAERNAHRRDIFTALLVLVLVLVGAVLTVSRHRRHYRKQMQALVRQIESLSQKAASQSPSVGTASTSSEGNTPGDNEALSGTESGEGTSEEAMLSDFLMRVIEVVNDALPRCAYGVEDIASTLNMSAATFRRRLQAAAGQSPKAYISAIQMNRAASLLTASPDMTIQQVAAECGFDEPANFSRAFKRTFDCSPTEYRENRAFARN